MIKNSVVSIAASLLALSAGCRSSASESKATEEAPAAQPAAPEHHEPDKPAAEAKPERTADGYEVIRAKTESGDTTTLEVKAPPGWKVTQPPSTPDPRGGHFTLKDALRDLPGKGPLVATIHTNMGAITCDLFEDKAPITVANFIGLARGTRETWSAKDQKWVAKPYYDGTTFHRVIPGFMIQGGDYAGDGSGNLWYRIPDEVSPDLKHDRAGQLCMANRGPNTNEGQFFITEGPAPHLDGSYTIFGQCSPIEIVNRIARVPQSGPPDNRPLTPVVMEHVTVERRANKAASAAPAEPKAPAGIPAGKAVQVDAPKTAAP
jgi:peptidyl-prolyl cis-trans isomerase A (cyclophilin A)